MLACRLARSSCILSAYGCPFLFPPKCAFVQSKLDALSLVCVQSYIQKLQEYYFAVLIYKFLIYVNDKGEESFYYNIKMCWIWLCIKR